MSVSAYHQFEREAHSKKSEYVIYRPIYIDITGDFFAGVLLSKLAHYFHKGLTLVRDDKRWRACTKEQWESEIRFTRSRLDRALSILKQMRLVIVKVKRWRGGWHTMLHIHLDEKELSKLIKKHLDTNAQILLSGKSKTSVPVSLKQAFVKEQKVGEQKEETEGICVAQKTGNEKQQKTKVTSNLLLSGLKKEKVPSKRKKGETMLAKDVMVKLNQASAEKYDDSFVPKNKTDLMGFWVYIVKLHHDTGYTKTGIKELGQLGHLMSGLKKQGIPVVSVIRWAVEYWKAFAMLATQEKNATLPSIPEIGKLLMYIDVAVNGMQGGKHKGLQSIAPKKKLGTGKFAVGKVI